MLATADKKPRYTLGVLFVHGIGEQRQGETLIRYGDSLATWFTRWLSRGDEFEPSWSDDTRASLSSTQLEPGESGPAESVLRLRGGFAGE